MRARWAFFLAPIIPAAVAGYNLHMHRSHITLLAGFMFMCLVFYFLEAVIGIPAFYALRRKRWRHFWIYAVVGFLAVFAPLFALCLVRWQASYEIGPVLYTCALVGIFGGAIGLIFWLLVRPDKDPIEQIASHFT
ncbi:hypothetical protein FJ987_19360 [Mesorhizobium sp. CU2]|uniref:hypothetical protein n=1 Tax=unclassified Mesorhizobium TaxID=325217 RepID=UPI001125FEA7|nr:MULTISPECIES: hypothetical protein [unclassified Mesorhizobium]TPN80778.1 hypothetical protein FJ988_20025 [Mesorhizobium sp. CU3]TPO11175.1 hypothetical protein FJ987_19360 [Mesorhizobium sp. CU2]